MTSTLKRYSVAIHDKSRTIYTLDANDGDEAVIFARMVWEAQRPKARHTRRFASWVQLREVQAMSVTDIAGQRTINTEESHGHA